MQLRKSFANVVQRRRQPNANLVWVGIAAWGIAEAISLLLSIWRSIVAQRAAISRRKNLSATAGQTGCRSPNSLIVDGPVLRVDSMVNRLT